MRMKGRGIKEGPWYVSQKKCRALDQNKHFDGVSQ